MLTIDTPDQVGLDPERWTRLLHQIGDLCFKDEIPSLGMVTGQNGKSTGTLLFGRQKIQGAERIRDDAIFLIASITKPIVGCAALLLVERGLISLDDPVTQYISGFGKNGKYGITIRNLLTHTSGLPDMVPSNLDLRKAGAPLSEFIREICELKPDFPPGRNVQYQSTGFAILADIIQIVTGKSCPEFLKLELFDPLGMVDTSLGAPDSWFEGAAPKANRIAEIRVPNDLVNETSWNWNSRYWLQLGAPWGGLLTTPMDLARFAHCMIQQGKWGPRQLLSPALVAAATRNQLSGMREVPREERRCRPWGLGWRLDWPAHSANFGDFLGPKTYGHWGATGTLLWIDPEKRRFLVLLSTQPQEPHGKLLARISSAVTASWLN